MNRTYVGSNMFAISRVKGDTQPSKLQNCNKIFTLDQPLSVANDYSQEEQSSNVTTSLLSLTAFPVTVTVTASVLRMTGRHTVRHIANTTQIEI